MNEYLSSMTMAVANHLWQSTAVIAAAWLLTLMLRGNTARTRQRIWMAASLKFLLPFSLLVGAGSHMVQLKPAVQDASALYAAMGQWAQPAIAAAVQLRPIGQSPRKTGKSPLGDALPIMLAVVWLCGFVVVVGVWAVRWHKIKRVVRAAVPMPEGRETEALLRVQRSGETRAAIRMLLTEGETGQRMEPGVMGVRRQVLLWPDGISERLSDAQLETILAHEMQHVKHRDNLMAMLHMAVEAMFWFHPLVWWMETRLVEERERACDEEVLRMGNQPAVYAQSILKTCEFCVESPMACVTGVTGAELKQRIVQIMSLRLGRELGLAKKVLLASVAALVFAGPLVFGVIYAPQLRAQEAKSDVPPELQITRDIHPLPELEVVTARKLEGDPVRGLLTTTMKSYIMNAYGISQLEPSLLVGGPSWVGSQQWVINGKPTDEQRDAEAKMTWAQVHLDAEMQRRRVLKDLFKLKTHIETREMPYFELVPAKGGLKMKEVAAAPVPSPGSPPQPLVEGTPGSISTHNREGIYVTNAHAIIMHTLIALIVAAPEVRGRPIVDKTGFKGSFDMVDMEWAGPQGSGGDATQDVVGASMFTALQEKLGLKLVATKGPMEVVVIDSIEQPSMN